MSYLRKIEFQIIPTDSYKVIRGCSCCQGKTRYRSTGNFRMNANGNKIDVWLIYQCEKCRHTLNLTVWERKRPEEIPKEEYLKLIKNDRRLAMRYGTDKSMFQRNKAEIAWNEMEYTVLPANISGNGEPSNVFSEDFPVAGDYMEISNDYGLKIRADKILAEIFRVSRSRVKKWEESGRILVEEPTHDRKIKVWIKENIKE